MFLGSIEARNTAGILTVILALILITPLCGFFFDCGCDWPWAGLHEKCNIYDDKIDSKCPWCLPWFTGVLSSGLAIAAGFLIAVSKPKEIRIPVNNAISELFIRLLLGMFAFLLTAAGTAWLASSTQAFFV